MVAKTMILSKVWYRSYFELLMKNKLKLLLMITGNLSIEEQQQLVYAIKPVIVNQN